MNSMNITDYCKICTRSNYIYGCPVTKNICSGFKSALFIEPELCEKCGDVMPFEKVAEKNGVILAVLVDCPNCKEKPKKLRLIDFPQKKSLLSRIFKFIKD